MPENTEINHPAAKFRAIAARIRNEPHAREAIADGFELIAASIEEVKALLEASGIIGCAECGQPAVMDELPATVLVPDLLPVIDTLDTPDLDQEINDTIKAA